jgi:hypothetical protein
VTTYTGINTKQLMDGRYERRTRMEAGDRSKLRFSSLIYVDGGLKVINLYADSKGVGWVWDDKQLCYVKASIYLPLIQLIKREDGDV